jgi:hypothetical protein
MRHALVAALLLASVSVAAPAWAQVPKPGSSPAAPPADRPAAVAPVPAVPPRTPQEGATSPVPEKVEPPGADHGTAGSAPFSGAPPGPLPSGSGTGQSGTVPRLSR